MKNIFYLMVSVIVIGASVIYACSREEFHGASEYHPSRVEQSYVQLQNDLIWYTEKFVSNKEYSTRSSVYPIVSLESTEVFVQPHLDLIPIQPSKTQDVVSADVRGAMIGSIWGLKGAILYGAGSSLIAAAKSSQVSVNSVVYATVDRSDNDSLGYFHNQIIADAMPLLSENEDEVSGDLIFDLTEQVMLQLSENYSETEIKEMETDFLHFLDIAILPPKEDWNNNIQEEYPEIAQDIQIINEYFETVHDFTYSGELLNYTHGFKEVINNSGISEEAKNRLTGSLNVAVNSFLLWTPIE